LNSHIKKSPSTEHLLKLEDLGEGENVTLKEGEEEKEKRRKEK
jgi:hypothetical protein